MIQLKAFGPNLVKVVYLLASDSPRGAFYTIWIERHSGGFRVCKESGGGAKVWQRWTWDFESLDEAEGLFKKRVSDKTNPKHPKRKYRLVYGA